MTNGPFAPRDLPSVIRHWSLDIPSSLVIGNSSFTAQRRAGAGAERGHLGVYHAIKFLIKAGDLIVMLGQVVHMLLNGLGLGRGPVGELEVRLVVFDRPIQVAAEFAGVWLRGEPNQGLLSLGLTKQGLLFQDRPIAGFLGDRGIELSGGFELLGSIGSLCGGQALQAAFE